MKNILDVKFPVSFHSRSPVKVWTSIEKMGSLSLKPINQTIISIFQETDKTEDRKSPPWSQCKSYKYRLVYFNDISGYLTVKGSIQLLICTVFLRFYLTKDLELHFLWRDTQTAWSAYNDVCDIVAFFTYCLSCYNYIIILEC